MQGPRRGVHWVSFGAWLSLNSKCRKPSVGIRSNKLRQLKSMGNENYDIILHVDLTR